MAYRNDTRTLARKHLERRLSPLRKTNDLVRPPRGWVKAIREALGMTTAQLASRIGVTQPRVAQIEKAEATDSITLKGLRQAAEGLDCELVYVLVPRKPLDTLLRERAEVIADRQLRLTHHTMRLENQALDPRDLKSERERLVISLIAGDPKVLWDER